MRQERTALEHRVPDGFELHRIGAANIVVRHGYEAFLSVLSGAVVPDEVELIGGGRARHPLVRLGAERALIRGYRRGGFVRHFNRRRYFGGHRAFAELRVTERARTRGVNVPFVLAATEKREALGYTAWIATRWIEDSAGAVDWLRRSPVEQLEVARPIGEQIGKMHRAGIAHPDLNLNNILVTGDGQSVTLVDFDRARVYEGDPPLRERIRNLERLGRSARRLRVEFGSGVWQAMREGYGADWPLRERLP